MRRICRVFRRSPTKNETLQGFIRAEFDGKDFKLKLDCETRWNSMFYMIERFLKLKNCVPKALRAVLSTEAVSESEWEQLELLISSPSSVELILRSIFSENATLLQAEDSMEFFLGKLTAGKNVVASELHKNLIERYQSRRNTNAMLLMFLRNPTDIKCKSTRISNSLQKKKFRDSQNNFILNCIVRNTPIF